MADEPKFIAAATGGIALVVATLAAVGISGDLLPRLVRNHPFWTAILVCGALLMVTLIIVIPSLVNLGVIGLAGFLVAILVFGVFSLNEREFPQIALVADVSENKVTLTVNAKASTMDSDEYMLVQIVGLTDILKPGPQGEACRNSWREDDEERDDLDVLVWNETGSAADGTAEVEVSAYAEAGKYEQFCALAILSSRSVSELAWAYIDAPALPAVESTDAPTPTP